MKPTKERKHKHHFVPKLYLKGFVEARQSPFVWVYVRGMPYNPGHKSHHNPSRRPISLAGAEEDHYAFKSSDGITDADTYENELEKLEKPSNPIIARLRQHKMLTEQEKKVFASYVHLMYKRVPRRKERLKSYWPHVSSSVLSEMAQWLDLEEASTGETEEARLARILELRRELEEVQTQFAGDTPIDSEIPLRSLTMDSPLGIPTVLSSMTWQFLVAPKGYGFLTSDDPVFPTGLDKPYSEISFPIASDTVLMMSWHDLDQGFFETSPEVVAEINRRTTSRALRQVYHSRAEEWIVDAMKEKREGYYLIYPFGDLRLTNGYDQWRSGSSSS